MPAEKRPTYVSPLLSRPKQKESLTLEILAREVPLVHAGRDAAELLNTENLERAEMLRLRRVKRAGDEAKERLILISLPLIKSLAHKEYRRRQSWSSRVLLDDIISEGLSGFLRGINAYNPDGGHKSPTNYIGQWILTDMRRNIEELEHDFSIPYEAMERQRKIRAIRSRLSSDLGRTPTDEEIIEAAAIQGQYGDTMLGRVNKKPANDGPPPRRRVITQKHIDEERDMARRTGAMLTSDVSTDDGDTMSTMDTRNAHSVTDAEHSQTGVAGVEAREVRAALQRLLEDSFTLIGIGETQCDIIRRKFALPPYDDEQTLKDIALHTSVPKHKVTKILTLFAQEMSSPGGVFHQLVSSLDEDDAESMGMSWVTSALGEYKQIPRKPPHRDLVNAIHQPSDRKNIVMPVYQSSRKEGVTAIFKCDHDDEEYSRTFIDEASIPATMTCSFCQHITYRIT